MTVPNHRNKYNKQLKDIIIRVFTKIFCYLHVTKIALDRDTEITACKQTTDFHLARCNGYVLFIMKYLVFYEQPIAIYVGCKKIYILK